MSYSRYENVRKAINVIESWLINVSHYAVPRNIDVHIS
jgi:hypothetical protein